MSHVKNFANFCSGMVLGLLKALFTEVDTFLLGVLAVLIGFAASPLMGGIVFLSVYLAIRQVRDCVELVARQLHTLAQVMHRG